MASSSSGFHDRFTPGASSSLFVELKIREHFESLSRVRHFGMRDTT